MPNKHMTQKRHKEIAEYYLSLINARMGLPTPRTNYIVIEDRMEGELYIRNVAENAWRIERTYTTHKGTKSCREIFHSGYQGKPWERLHSFLKGYYEALYFMDINKQGESNE